MFKVPNRNTTSMNRRKASRQADDKTTCNGGTIKKAKPTKEKKKVLASPKRQSRLSVRLGPVPNSRLYRPAPPRPPLPPPAPHAVRPTPRPHPAPCPHPAPLSLGPLHSASSIIHVLTEQICELRRERRAERPARPPPGETRPLKRATSLVVKIPSLSRIVSATESYTAQRAFNPAGIPHHYPAQVVAHPESRKISAGDAREIKAVTSVKKNCKQVKISKKVILSKKETPRPFLQRRTFPQSLKKSTHTKNKHHVKRALKEKKPRKKSAGLRSNLTLLNSASKLIAQPAPIRSYLSEREDVCGDIWRLLDPRKRNSSALSGEKYPEVKWCDGIGCRMAKDAGPREHHQRHSISPEELSDYGEGNDAPSAPNEYLAEFLSSIMQRKYVDALKYCKLILQYEPNNVTAKEFYPLLQQKLQFTEKEDEFSDEDLAQPEKEEYENGSGSSDDGTDKQENDLSFCEDGLSEEDCSDVEGLLDEEGTDEVEEAVSTGSDSRVEITSPSHTSGETDNSANNYSGLEDEEDNRSYECDDDNGNAVTSHYTLAYGRRIFATHSTLQPDPNDGNQNDISASASNITYLQEAAKADKTAASTTCLHQLRAQFVHSVK